MRAAIVIIMVLAFMGPRAAHAADMNTLIDPEMQRIADVVAQVESRGNVDTPRGDGGYAYGILQIHQGCLTDVNRANGTNFTLEQVEESKELSYWVFAQYMKLYARPERLGHEPTLEDMGRIWNGGPNGYKRSSTVGYAQLIAKAAHALGYYA